MRCLLDVNILIALLDGNHVFHTRVHDWLGPHQGGLATCAITQNGAIRIMSQPRYSSLISLTAAHVRQQLQMGLTNQNQCIGLAMKACWTTGCLTGRAFTALPS